MTVMERLGAGRVRRHFHEGCGNGALLVLVDSGGPYHNRSIVVETILVALEHFGMPYRLLDLAHFRPTAGLLAGCAGLVIAQDGLGERLSEAESELIADAVAEGMGLVSFDGDLRGYKGPLLEVFGFRGVERLPYASNLFLVPANDHYITWLHEPRAFHESQRMVTAVMVKEWRDDVTVLCEAVLGKEQLIYIRHLVPGNAYEPKHYPMAFATRWGQGRAVQWAVNPRLWRRGALGHLGGLDDLFWRGIVWTARKSFVTHMVPPFVTMSFDDCSGWHGFRYLDVCTRHGYTPLVSLYLDRIRESHRPLLRAKAAAGEILLNTHGWDYYRLHYWDFGSADFNEEEVKLLFEQEDEFYRWLGAEPCRVVVCHFGEMGVRSLPHLKQRRRTFIRTPTQLSVLRADQFLTEARDGYWPYGSMECFYDYAPDDNDFLFFGSFNARHLADFLTGATLWLRESPGNNLEKAAEQAAWQVRNGLMNGFFGDVLTHEQKLEVLTLEEWDHILERASQKTTRCEQIFSNHNHIAAYLRSKDRTRLAKVVRADDGSLSCLLSGTAEQSLRLSVFRDMDGGVERTFVDVPAFSGQQEARVAA